LYVFTQTRGKGEKTNEERRRKVGKNDNFCSFFFFSFQKLFLFAFFFLSFFSFLLLLLAETIFIPKIQKS